MHFSVGYMIFTNVHQENGCLRLLDNVVISEVVVLGIELGTCRRCVDKDGIWTCPWPACFFHRGRDVDILVNHLGINDIFINK